jgi:hypothetical protein
MVSSKHKGDFTAQLFRSVSADPNPKGQGIVEYACDEFFTKQTFSSREQKFNPGSYGITEQPFKMNVENNFFNKSANLLLHLSIFKPNTQ